MKTALVIMAAGMGSRFGGGIKQLEPVGPNGEIIMDYSIHDAIATGFNKVVFIIRKDIKEAFHDAIGKRIEGICNRLNVEFAYAYQELDDLPEGIKKPVDRNKPWGTGQAVLVCKDIIKEPFVVINADDYYGKEAFVKIHEFLINNYTPERSKELCMAGFILGNTLSDNGTVTRGICVEDEAGYLHRVIETKGIIRNNQGTIDCDTEESKDIIQENNRVSMNMWAGYPCFIDYLENGFKEFLLDDSGDELTKEYLLPIIVDQLIKTNRASVKVLETTDKWFGVTYPEDKQIVQDSINELIEQGIYPEKLWK
jgi:bifunctional N-acetylglucosamine-1-phosphate-uridyltransferase/glucosamine-1-phosphate-acetyltransferase GlmU-like protein